MLKEFRSIDVYWDKATRRIYEEVRASSSDEKGRKLTVQIVNDGQIQDLTNVALNLYWETQYGESRGLDPFEPLDAENGIYELYFRTGMLKHVGKLNAHLHLVDTTGAITSEPFSIYVFKGVDVDAMASDDELSALTQALVQVQDLKQTWNDKWQNLQDQINAVRNLVSDLTSVIEITGDFTLSEGVEYFAAYKLGHLRFIRFYYQPTKTGFTQDVITTSKHRPFTRMLITVSTTNSAPDSARGISSHFSADGNLTVVTPEVPSSSMLFSGMYFV